ncbi:phosphoesterase family-domain-containing protein [Aspergillus karnatakaensis]|uniref:putative acid phosphatase n=1 Tax=Aspergillus karnatakaensis TaxID=1810916 RepID=UPI003CCC90F4
MYTTKTLLALLSALTVAVAQTSSEQTPSQAEIDAARATVKPYSPTSNVKGKSFQRFVNIWLENTDYDAAAAETHLAKLASKGLTLTNYWAVTHPSEPNYAASAAGDYFGMNNDDFNQFPANISTIADLFDTKNISWGEYQEHLPYPGYQGFRYPDAEDADNDYVRKHNPMIFFDSVTSDPLRLRQIKNFTSFYDDLAAHKLPQYSFITPNMTNDGHDTDISFSGTWTWEFLIDLLDNEYFTKDTLILLTFDENDTYELGNKVFSFLLGGAVPDSLLGKEDDTFYTHYSIIASLSANFGLPSLGRWDCGANILSFLAEKIGYVNYNVDTQNLYLNESYPGPLYTDSDDEHSAGSVWAVPKTKGECSAGYGILDLVKRTWGGLKASHEYRSPVPFDVASGHAVGVKYSRTVDGKEEEFVTGVKRCKAQ